MNHQNFSMAMDSSKPLDTMEILKATFFLPTKSKKLMVCLMLLCFLPSSLLLMCNYTSIYPLLLNFLMKLHLITQKAPNTPEFFDAIVGLKNEAEQFIHVQMIYAMASYMVSTVTTTLILRSSTLIHWGKQPCPNDLVSKLKSNWINVFVTRIFFSLLYIGYSVMSICLIAIPMLSASGSMILIVIGGLAAVVARLVYVYLAMMWMVGVVISVEEEKCYGLEALWKGGEVVRGRRAQGFFIALILLLVEGVLTGGYGFWGAKNGKGLIVVNLMVVMKMYSEIVYAVFYCECRKEVAYTRMAAASGEVIP